MRKVHSYFDCPCDPGLTCSDPSLTQQHFRDEADINHIISRYENTGFLTDPLLPPTNVPQFGDYCDVADFQTAQNIIAHSMQAFDALPAHIRKRFNNDPATMLAFLEKEENRDDAIKLGLVQERSPEPITDIAGASSNDLSTK